MIHIILPFISFLLRLSRVLFQHQTFSFWQQQVSVQLKQLWFQLQPWQLIKHLFILQLRKFKPQSWVKIRFPLLCHQSKLIQVMLSIHRFWLKHWPIFLLRMLRPIELKRGWGSHHQLFLIQQVRLQHQLLVGWHSI